MSQRSFLSRRSILMKGTTITLGGLLATFVGGEWLFAQAKDTDGFIDQLHVLYKNPNTPGLLQSLSTIGNNPAYSTLATNILTGYSASLTSFQRSLLQAFLIMMKDPAVISAVLSGHGLTEKQEASLDAVKSQLSKNPAIRTILDHANDLRKPANTQLLQSYVNANALVGFQLNGPGTSLGDATLDAVVADTYSLIGSSAFQNLEAPVASIMQRTDFVTFLQKQRAEVLASYIPSNVVLSFLLPHDQDPPLSQSILDEMGLIWSVLSTVLATIAFATAAIAFLGPTGVVLAIAGGIEIDATLLILRGMWMGYKWGGAVNSLYDQLDCDHDGDPSDPADVPGNECP